MTSASRPLLRLVRGGRTDDDGRHSVDLYRHDTHEVRTVTWTLPRLLTAIRRLRPRHPGDPNWTFSVGRRRSVVITTEGPRTFSARETIKATDGLIAELRIHKDLLLRDVVELLEPFYGGPDRLSKTQLTQTV
jgi:hypothetical protein